MNPSDNLKQIVEAALLASGKAMTLDKILELFDEMERPEKKDLRAVLQELSEDYADRGIEIKEVASGWRIQVSRECAPWVSRLWEEKPGRYSRALMETLALIAYRQPITRGEIEDIRGVSVSTHIMRTLLEREWVRVVGQRDVPGKPSLYGTTREFLDYFGLKSLDELPTLAEIRDLDVINEELNLQEPDGGAVEQTTDEQKASDQEEMPAPDTSETTDEENSREEHALEPEPEPETETEPGTITAADMDTDEKQT
ncbi:SMC-Scp complex subunit ScpB [Thiolapillus sp.]|uniref:SMC-Scp complex subunit ScpB n=2 Tax=Thiolapillus sp. TaxID=2017437 RepID=UPI003AF85E45